MSLVHLVLFKCHLCFLTTGHCMVRMEILSFFNNMDLNLVGKNLNIMEGGIKYLLGSNSAYSTAGVVIANGASTNLYIPLVSIFSSSRLFLGGLRDDPLIRFVFNPASINVISGNNSTVTNCSLSLCGCFLLPSV